jgi:glycosyltransferase involved in cell wall biosynthesis
MVTNKGLLTYVLQLGASPESIQVIGHGIDPSQYEDVTSKGIREELGFKEADQVIFFMGWLYEFCGLDIVIDQMELSGRHLKLLVIGKGEMAPLLRERASKNPNIVLLDWMPFNELPKYIMASDVCVLPFINNEITSNIVPIKIYEYLAAGKPVISTALPGVVQEFGHDGPVYYMNHPSEIISVLDDLMRGKGRTMRLEKVTDFLNEHSWDNKVMKFKGLITNSDLPIADN